MRRARTLAAALAALALACARPGTPSGGPADRRPPVVVEAEPAPLARVDDPSARVRFRFSERISERPARGLLDDAVMVSPLTGAVRVQHGSEELEVTIAGGLQPGLVYRVTVLPVIVDLFSNRMTDPFEIVFSTGGELNQNAVAGQAVDRITGRPVADALVALLPASPVPDTVRYLARTDQGGLFFFRYVPPERFSLVAFEDRNRNLTPDPSETQGSRGVLVPASDTLLTDVTLIAPDTTPPQLIRVEVTDSTTLRLVFTDYLDPAEVERAVVSVAPLDGDDPAPSVTRVLHPETLQTVRDSLAAARDSADGDAARPAGRVPGTGRTVTIPGQERGGLPGGIPLPRQELIATLSAPLVVERSYVVTATRVINVYDAQFGGGQDTIVRPAQPPPPPRPGADSTAAPPDTLDAPADSLDQPADTARLGFRAPAIRRRR